MRSKVKKLRRFFKILRSHAPSQLQRLETLKEPNHYQCTIFIWNMFPKKFIAIGLILPKYLNDEKKNFLLRGSMLLSPFVSNASDQTPWDRKLCRNLLATRKHESLMFALYYCEQSHFPLLVHCTLYMQFTLHKSIPLPLTGIFASHSFFHLTAI